jgi:ABC-2 type transport system ATP-binding protein
MAETVIEARGLRKTYGSFAAVDGVDLTIAAGTVFGVLGPNGSGKTTTILMLMGLTEVTAGTVRVMGLDPTRQPLEVKRLVGYMPDSVGFYDHLTARHNLRYTGRLAGVPSEELDARIAAALARVDLTAQIDKPAGALSHGMRRRLGLADMLLKRPRIAILDEPTSGLDPSATHEFLDLIRDLKREGMTILLSSHLLDQVQAVCDRVGLFYRGRMVLEGTVGDLARQVLGARHRIVVEARGVDATVAVQRVPAVVRVERTPTGYAIDADADVRGAAVAAVAGAGGEVLGVTAEETSLDAIYTRYFREARNAAA